MKIDMTEFEMEFAGNDRAKGLNAMLQAGEELERAARDAAARVGIDVELPPRSDLDPFGDPR